MKTRIYCENASQPNYVTVAALDDMGKMRTTEYFVPAAGGYVKVNDGRHYPQVCDRLSSGGSTLVWRPGGISFVDFIRREYKAGRDAERRRVQREGF